MDNDSKESMRRFLENLRMERRSQRRLARLFPGINGQVKQPDGPPRMTGENEQMGGLLKDMNELQAFENKMLKREV